MAKDLNLGKKDLLKLILLLLMYVGSSLSGHGQSGIYNVVSSSFISDNSNTDQVTGSRIQSDGTVVLGVNTTATSVGGIAASYLNGATSASAGTVVRLNSAGDKVLSVTKVGAKVLDLAIDASNNIYAALGTGGFVKLNSVAEALVYQRANGGNCRRIDAGNGGAVVALNNTGGDAGKIYVYNAAGTELYNTDGKNFTQDVAINDDLQLFYSIGYRNANTACNPVQICYMIARNFSGTEVWRNYDWAANLLDDCDGTPRDNNMADTRGYRITMGEDGKLYGAFECAGGNHIFRYNPKDLSKSVTVVGGDAYFSFYNTRDEHKTFFARFDASTGNYLLGQQFCARPSGTSGPANAVRIKDGEIRADANGRVYIGGVAGDGLPLTFDVPEAGNTTGGAFLMVVSSDFTSRLFVTRLYSGEVNAIDTRTISGKVSAVLGGKTDDGKLYLKNAIQSSPLGGPQEGAFAVLNFVADKVAPTVSITSPITGSNVNVGSNVTITATASDTDGTVAKVDFYKDDLLLGSDNTTPFSFTWNNAPAGSYILRAKATDNEGFTAVSDRIQLNVTVPAVNLALNKTVTFSYQQGGNEAYKAVDGDISTRWSSTPYPQWMEIDLGAVYDVNRTEMVCYADRAYQFKVEVKSAADAAYVTVVDRTKNTKAGLASDPIADVFTNTKARFVKLTVTGEANNASEWISIAEFRVFSVPTVTNAPPSVSITSPVTNTTFAVGSTINIQASAGDSDGSVTKVEFFNGTTKLGEDTGSPYAYALTNAVAGNYSLTAKATDDKGVSFTSSVVTITVSSDSILRTPENPANTTAGLNYSYYEGSWNNLPDFTSLTPVKTGTSTNFDISLRNKEDNFAFKFTGYIDIPADGQYTFYTSSDDGSKLLIGSTEVVNNDGLHAEQEKSGKIGLKKGKHAITVTFFELGGGQGLSVSYEGPSVTKQAVPVSALFRASAIATVVYAINAGGVAYTAVDGAKYEADKYFTGGTPYTSSTTAIAGTDDDVLYTSERYGNFSYALPVANGTYDITFKFSENYWTAAGQRALNVSVEGTQVITNLDIYSSSGAGFKAYDIVKTATVSDGTLNINFVTVTDNAKISAILVKTSTSSASRQSPEIASSGLAPSKLNIYPNPTSGLIQIETPDVKSVEIFNIQGRRVLAVTNGESKIDLSNLSPGVYTIKIHTADKVYIQKIIRNN